MNIVYSKKHLFCQFFYEKEFFRCWANPSIENFLKRKIVKWGFSMIYLALSVRTRVSKATADNSGFVAALIRKTVIQNSRSEISIITKGR